MKLGWLSDIHLNFLDNEERDHFFDDLATHNAQGWLLSGDIGEAWSVTRYLKEFGDRLAVPTYFVLGNHDFYNGSIATVNSEVSELNSSRDNLIWLAESGPMQLNETVALVGADCMADGRFGNPLETPVMLNDFSLIGELIGHSRKDLINLLRHLADETAARLREDLHAATTMGSHVVVVLHVPPFEGATWHEGEISSPDWLPWFSCEASGLALASVASAHPETNFTVFCGHTHSGGRFSPSANVTVYTAFAEYARPGVQAVIEFGTDAFPSMVGHGFS